jgi:hypothetical protein
VAVVKAVARVVAVASTPARSAPTKSAPAKKAASSGVYIERVEREDNRLRVYPTLAARITAPQKWQPFQSTARESSWQEVIKMAPEVKNNNSMKDQYMCHWDGVSVVDPMKESWNLDIGRPDVGYFQTVVNACNPH